MSVIFYWQATGEIYGVHPDGDTAPPVPAGVSQKTVAETPDNILWPIPANYQKGRQRWTKVNPTTLALEVDTARLPNEGREFDKFDSWVVALAVWTRQKLNALKADPLTTELPRTGAQQKQEVINIWRGLQ